MFKRNQFYAAVTAVSLSTLSVGVFSQEVEEGSASVQVSNAFVLQQTAGLNMGTFVVDYQLTDSTAPFTTAGAINLKGDGSYDDVVESAGGGTGDIAELTLIAPGSPGTFQVSGAAPNTPLTVEFETGVTLARIGNLAVVFELEVLNSYTAANEDHIQVLDGPGAGQVYTGTNLITDATGAVNFAYGGTLSLPLDYEAVAGANPYTDGTYSGTYDVTVSY
jgi:hypothetical protein